MSNTCCFCALITWLCFNTIAFQAVADDSESDSLEVKKEHAFYLAPAYQNTGFADTRASFVGIYAGVVLLNHFDINVHYTRNIDAFKKQIIFPLTYKFQQDNIGLSVNYIFLESKIRPLASIGGQYVSARWEHDGETEEAFSDNLFIWNIAIGGIWEISRLLMLQLNAGYGLSETTNLVGLLEDDFSGFRVDVQLKFYVIRF